MRGYDLPGGGKASAPKVTCPICGATYLRHWMSIRFLWPDGTRASSGFSDRQDVRKTDTHVLACQRRAAEVQGGETGR